MIKTDDIRIVKQLFCNAGFAMSEIYIGIYSVPIRLHFRKNPDGSIRWLWPANTKQANCLRFYNAGSAKAAFFSKLITRAFAYNCERFFSNGNLVLFTDTATAESISTSWGANYALFTGTTGPNRKGIVWYEKNGVGYFMKVALHNKTACILQRELSCLDYLTRYSFRFLQYPEVVESAHYYASFTDICTDGSYRSAILSELHYKALQELADQSGGTCQIRLLSQWTASKDKLVELGNNPDARMPSGLIRKLQYLLSGINEEKTIAYTLSHGDFTPWNMYVSADKLQVYDWELYIEKAPTLWDIFHFIFQSGILVHHHTASSILHDIYELQYQPFIPHASDGKERDIHLHLQLYMLMNCIYYLHLYAQQTHWHVQVYWLLETWNEVLSVMLASEKIESARQLLCIDVFDWLQNRPYVALKWTTGKPEALSPLSDIDLCVEKGVLKPLFVYLSQHPLVNDIQVSKNSFMHTYTILTNDGALLSIDAIFKLKRKGLQMLDTRDFLKNVQHSGYGVKLPPVSMNFAYTWLFYLLNKAAVPEKYRDYFLALPETDQDQLNDYFKRRWKCTGLTHFNSALNNSATPLEAVLKQIAIEPYNKGIPGFKNRLQYLLDLIRGLFTVRGITITFSGVDGAGKSTVIDMTREQLEKKLRKKVVVLRHRPSILPILSAYKYGKAGAEKKSVASLPRQGKNRSGFSSFIRFMYYFTDYLLGQCYIQCKYVWRGYIVLYDRYYFDFINDGRRSNIHLSPRFISWCYRFLLKPDLNFFLYADTAVILRRKQELDAATINELTDKYLRLFTLLSKQYRKSRYIPIHNEQLDTTINTIMDQIKKMVL